MSKYRVTLTIHETAAMSKEDFRKLQGAVDQIAELTDFRMILDNEAVNASNIATFMQMVPKKALEPFDSFNKPHPAYPGQFSEKLGFNFLPPNENDITQNDIYGHGHPLF